MQRTEAVAMIFTQIPVMHIEQETGEFCGPAAAQMVLAASGFALETQSELYARWCHGQGDVGWASSPLGISRTLTRRMPEQAALHQIATANSADSLSRQLCWTIGQGAAPIVLVNGTNHWIVVNGFGASAPPVTIHDSSYFIDHVSVHDPAIRRAFGSEECQLLQVVAYAEWRRNYLRYPVSPALMQNPAYQGMFVGICAVESDESDRPVELEATTGETRSPDRAMLDAITALKSAPALQRTPWNELGETLIAREPVWTPGPWGDDDGVYHVPFCCRRNASSTRRSPRFGGTSGGPRGAIFDREAPAATNVPLIVRVGGWEGEFRGAIACPGGGIDLVSVAPRESWEEVGLL